MNESFRDKSQSEIKSLKRRQSLYQNVLNTNLSITELQALDLKEYNTVMRKDIKTIESLNGQKRLLNQLNIHIKDIEKYHFEKNDIENKAIKEAIVLEGRRLVQKEGQYTTVEVAYNDGTSKWIKFANQKDYKRQLDKVRERYGTNYTLIFHRFNKYAVFFDKQFAEQIESLGIKI